MHIILGRTILDLINNLTGYMLHPSILIVIIPYTTPENMGTFIATVNLTELCALALILI